MADYYPLIARAVAGLEKNTGDARRALYERARAALVAQLRSVNPPLSEVDVTRERLALSTISSPGIASPGSIGRSSRATPGGNRLGGGCATARSRRGEAESSASPPALD